MLTTNTCKKVQQNTHNKRNKAVKKKEKAQNAYIRRPRLHVGSAV